MNTNMLLLHAEGDIDQVYQSLALECEAVAQNQRKRKLEVEIKVQDKRRIVTQIVQKVQAMNRSKSTLFN
jgi:hypothetical protein